MIFVDQIPSPRRQNRLSSIYGQSQLSLAPSHNSLKSLASDVVAYHFCQIDNESTCLVPEFVHSLAAQLSQAPQLKPFHQLLSTDHDLRNKLALVQCVADPDSALLQGILHLRDLLDSLQLWYWYCLHHFDRQCSDGYHSK